MTVTVTTLPSNKSALLSLAIGTFFLLLGYSLGSRATPTSLDSITDPLEDETEPPKEDIPDGDLAAIKAGFTEPCKLVLLVRTDLKMPSGTVATQCGQATVLCYKALAKQNPKLVRHWEVTGQAKIALKITSETQLLELEAKAKSLNLCARAVVDQGARTVLAIGPAPVDAVNQVTGKLRLL